MLNDLGFAFRQLRRNPGLTAVVVSTLPLGIGANTAIFGLVDTALLPALPYPEPGRLVHSSERSASGDDLPVSYPNFLDWQRQQEVFDGLAVFHQAEGKLKTECGAERVEVLHVSADFFRILGVRPSHGRDMRPDDDRPGTERGAGITTEA